MNFFLTQAVQLPYYFVHNRLRALGDSEGMAYIGITKKCDAMQQLLRYGGYTRDASDVVLEECFEMLERNKTLVTESVFAFIVLKARRLQRRKEEEERAKKEKGVAETLQSSSNTCKGGTKRGFMGKPAATLHGFGSPTHDASHLKQRRVVKTSFE